MRYRLRTDLHCCSIDGQTLCLDVRENRYFGLSSRAGNAMRRALAGQTDWGDSDDALAKLISRGLLVPASDECIWRNVSLKAPEFGLCQSDTPRSLVQVSHAVVAQTQAALKVRYRPLSAILSSLQARKSRLPEYGNVAESARLPAIIGGFASANLLLGSTDRCLISSLAFTSICLRRRLPVSLMFGVRTGPFAAHCWVQDGDTVLNDSIERVRLYTPIVAL